MTVVASTMLTRISTSTALTTDSPKSPMLKPTMVAASVAAACGVERANTTADCGGEKPSSGRIRKAAISLPPTQARMKTPARPSVSACTITLGSSSRPTETRKTGMKSAEPKKSMRSISGPSLGTSRLRARPAKNAPTMPSMPNVSATTAAARNDATASR